MEEPYAKNDIGSLARYFEQRFQVLEQELRLHSGVLSTINSNVQKLLECRQQSATKEANKLSSPLVDDVKEFTLQNSLHEHLKETQQKPREAPNQSRSRNKENALGPAATEPAAGKSRGAKQSPSFGKASRPKEDKVPRKQPHAHDEYEDPGWRKKNICIDPVDYEREELEINSVFSPSQHTGQTKELIIEAIDVPFHESPARSAVNKKGVAETTRNEHKDGRERLDSIRRIVPSSTTHGRETQEAASKSFSCNKYSYRSKSPNNESCAKLLNKSSLVQNTKQQSRAGYRAALPTSKAIFRLNGPAGLCSLPGSCLYLVGAFLGGAIPGFVFSCRAVMGKYAGHAAKKVGVRIECLCEQYNAAVRDR